jgi:hypothetical protein
MRNAVGNATKTKDTKIALKMTKNNNISIRKRKMLEMIKPLLLGGK